MSSNSSRNSRREKTVLSLKNKRKKRNYIKIYKAMKMKEFGFYFKVRFLMLVI